MIGASIPFQSAATLAVAIIGMVSTLLAGYLARQKESAAERARWVRDRRIEPYIALTEEYRKTLALAEESWSINHELAAMKAKTEQYQDELTTLQAEVDDAVPGAEVAALNTRCASISAEVDESRKRLEKLRKRSKRLHKDLWANVEQLDKLITPLRLLGSDRVKELSVKVQKEITSMLAASIRIEKPPDAPLFERWDQLYEAMRNDLGVAAPKRLGWR